MEDTRIEPPFAETDERALLTGFLDFHRGTLEWKCAGLTDEQLRTRSVATADITLLGMLRHLAEVERYWFREVWAAERFETALYGNTDDPDEDWNDLGEDTGPAALARLHAEIEAARKIVESTPDFNAVHTRPNRVERVSARWILIHMIEEYSRHNGHADLLREAIDGEVGE
jgi:uncharacterized damage-inducible protein DinB